uniref:Transposase n=1 Tax=Fischerella sp. ATCC 43239 TaxID=1535197 RepID=A0A076NA36_9CYAN|nr:transposase [Fischerella sp. ATCC 43239]
MKAYSIDFREKIINAYEQGNTSIRKIASRFDVSKAFVQRLLLLKRTQGHVNLQKQGGGMKSDLDKHKIELAQMVEKYPDATLSEYCEYWGQAYDKWVSTSAMCRALQRQNLTQKKKTLRSSQAKTERVQKLRIEYWQQIQQIDPENLVFIDEMGVLLGLTRTHARSPHGSRVYDFKPFYRGAKVTVIGAISLKQVLAVMTLNGSMDGNAFKVFIEKCLLPQLWSGAVVVMDNVPAHKVEEIESLIQSKGASVLYQSPYSPDFNPIEHWWSQLKSFLRSFSPTTAKLVDILIATALDLINPIHLKNWFTNCCYCTS